MREVAFYRNEAGNVLALVGAAGKELTVDGQKYTLLVAGSTDAATEKHVPTLQKIDNVLEVEVGSVEHPSEEKHYIEWIALVTDKKVEIRYLKPGQKPKAVFDADDHGIVYAYCNLHGLWKEEFAVQHTADEEQYVCSPEFGGCRLV